MFEIKPNSILAAPMAGISDHVFRVMCKKFGADIVFTEMISAEGLRRGHRKTHEMLYYTEDERPIGVQLFDDSPEAIGEAAKITAEYGFDFIDINLGCPAKKVVRKGAGSALLKDIKKAEKIVQAAIEAVNIPVSVKTRTGWDFDDDMYLYLLPIFKKMGVKFMTFHPRYRNQMFSGRADWTKIQKAVDSTDLPIVGNGDIIDEKSAATMLEQTGCHSIMIARASLGNPWIFERCKQYLNSGNKTPTPSKAEKIQLCADYVSNLVRYYGEKRGLNIAKKHVIWFTRGMSNAKQIRIESFAAESLERLLEIILREKDIAYAL